MNSILESFNDPASRHAIFAHFPVVLSMLGVLPVLALALTGYRNQVLRTVALAWFVAATIGAGLASGAGEDAEHRLEEAVPALSAVEHAALERHEELGEDAWRWPLGVTALVCLTFIPHRVVRHVTGGLAIVGAAGVMVWCVLTAHAGGALVYTHGLGVPPRAGSLDGQVQDAVGSVVDLVEPASPGEDDHDDDDD